MSERQISDWVPVEAHSELLEELEKHPEVARIDAFLLLLNPRQERYVRKQLESLRGADTSEMFYVRGGSFIGSSEWRPRTAWRVMQAWLETPAGLENASKIPPR